LPALPPGCPVALHLDPFAGFICRRYSIGTLRPWIQAIDDWSQCKHYITMPTALYRQKFGCWKYAILNWDETNRRAIVPSIVCDGWSYELPDELIQRGTCRLTALLDDTGALLRASAPELVSKLSQLLLTSPEPDSDDQPSRYIDIIRYSLGRVSNEVDGQIYEFLPAAATVRTIHRGIIECAPCCGNYNEIPAPVLAAVRAEHGFQNRLLLKTLLRIRSAYAPVTRRKLLAEPAPKRI
jgi:hypothetical protein